LPLTPFCTLPVLLWLIFFHFAGLCVLVGITHDDTKDDSDYLYVYCSAP